ncbi:MAG: hypothetical protein AAF961_00335 [Planctomycetota bacterium]
MSSTTTLTCGLVGLIAAAGCDSGPLMAPVQGVVNFDEQPVAKGTIQLYPVQSGPMAAGRLSADGTFELTTKTPGDGALVGEHIVVVTPPSDVNELQRTLKEGQRRREQFRNIPESVRNQQTSSLRVTVEPGDNELEIDLSDALDNP